MKQSKQSSDRLKLFRFSFSLVALPMVLGAAYYLAHIIPLLAGFVLEHMGIDWVEAQSQLLLVYMVTAIYVVVVPLTEWRLEQQSSERNNDFPNAAVKTTCRLILATVIVLAMFCCADAIESEHVAGSYIWVILHIPFLIVWAGQILYLFRSRKIKSYYGRNADKISLW